MCYTFKKYLKTTHLNQESYKPFSPPSHKQWNVYAYCKNIYIYIWERYFNFIYTYLLIYIKFYLYIYVVINKDYFLHACTWLGYLFSWDTVGNVY